jgi:drug/metabolite transporter (DMT)-like permease
MDRLSTRTVGTLAVVAATASWGVATVMTKHALGGISPFFLLAFQLGLSVLLLWTAVFRKGLRPTWQHLRRISLPGLLNPGLAYALALVGLASTTASMSTLLWATEPILILILVWPVLGERWQPGPFSWAMVGLLGAALVAGYLDNQSLAAVGNSLILLGVACCALHTVITSRTARENEPLLIAAAQQSAAFGMAVVLVAADAWFGRSFGHLEPTGLLWAALAGFLYYTAGFWLYFIGLRHLPAIRVGMMLNLVPVVGVSVAAMTLNERLTGVQILGGLLILGGVVGALLTDHRHQ